MLGQGKYLNPPLISIGEMLLADPTTGKERYPAMYSSRFRPKQIVSELYRRHLT